MAHPDDVASVAHTIICMYFPAHPPPPSDTTPQMARVHLAVVKGWHQKQRNPWNPSLWAPKSSFPPPQRWKPEIRGAFPPLYSRGPLTVNAGGRKGLPVFWRSSVELEGHLPGVSALLWPRSCSESSQVVNTCPYFQKTRGGCQESLYHSDARRWAFAMSGRCRGHLDSCFFRSPIRLLSSWLIYLLPSARREGGWLCSTQGEHSYSAEEEEQAWNESAIHQANVIWLKLDSAILSWPTTQHNSS